MLNIKNSFIIKKQKVEKMRPLIEKGKVIKMTNVNTGETRWFPSFNKAGKATDNKPNNIRMYASGFGIQLKGWKIEIVSLDKADKSKIEF